MIASASTDDPLPGRHRQLRLLSLVIPVFNEEEALPHLLQELHRVLAELPCEHEIVFINDGSRDGTGAALRTVALADSRIKVLQFSRNFGHQIAVTAGLDFATGDAVVVMDADLQDPPDLLPALVEKFEQGYDIVSPQRSERQGETWFKKTTASLFYKLMRRGIDARLPEQVGDFRLFSRSAVLAMRQFREQHRFLRGLAVWLGMRECLVPFQRSARVAGTTKYPLHKMLKFAWTAISSFSAAPLRLVLWTAGFLFVIGLLATGDLMVGWLAGFGVGLTLQAVICMQLYLTALILAAIGLVGDYVARIFDEAKGRPLYVVGELQNFPHDTTAPPRCILVDDQPLRPPVQYTHPPGPVPTLPQPFNGASTGDSSHVNSEIHP